MPSPDEPAGTRLLASIDEIAAGYDVLLCDLWGCYHDGLTPYPAAMDALRRFRAGGGAVVLLTNAPRPRQAVEAHLLAMGAARDTYDAIVSSGDATRAALESGAFGQRFHIVGPERDRPIWEGTDIEPAALDAADAILCTGLFDDATETPETYAALVRDGVARGLVMLCANPDVIVDRGSQRLYCAGAIAEAYAAAGGDARFFGKPHAPIYERAIAVARTLRPELENRRVLAIGDGIATDVLGAERAGLDAVFVTGGLAADAMGAVPEAPDPAKLRAYLAEAGRRPAFAIGRLR